MRKGLLYVGVMKVLFRGITLQVHYQEILLSLDVISYKEIDLMINIAYFTDKNVLCHVD